MKIVYLYPSLAIWGGIERVLVDKMNYLVRQYGYDVYMITSDQGNHLIPYDLDERVSFIDLDIRFHTRYQYKRLFRYLKYCQQNSLYHQRLKKQLNIIQPDILVCTTHQNIGSLLRIKGSIPLVVESHMNFVHADTMVQQLRTFFNNYWIGKAEAVVTLTDGDAEDWRRVSSHVHVISNVVSLNDTNQYSDNTCKRVLFIGRFAEQKGIGDLLVVWQKVYPKFPDWHLDLYGEGELWEKYEHEAKTMNMNINLHKPTSQIFEVYRHSSVFVLSSVYEPFGLVMPEAMSCGLPVVAFDCPYGPASIIAEGEDGFLIPDRDHQKFADKLCLLMESLELRQQMGKKAIESSKRFTAKEIMPMWKQLFEHLASLS